MLDPPTHVLDGSSSLDPGTARRTGLQRLETQRFASGPSSAGIARGLIEAPPTIAWPSPSQAALGPSSAGIARGLIEARSGPSSAGIARGLIEAAPTNSLGPLTQSSAGIARGLIEAEPRSHCASIARGLIEARLESGDRHPRELPAASLKRGGRWIRLACHCAKSRSPAARSGTSRRLGSRRIIRGNCPRPH